MSEFIGWVERRAKVGQLEKNHQAKRAQLDKDYQAKIAQLDKDYLAKIAQIDKDDWDLFTQPGNRDAVWR